MKRNDLVKELEQSGCMFHRHGGRHDWYRNPRTGVCQPIPGHREADEHLARHIIRKMKD